MEQSPVLKRGGRLCTLFNNVPLNDGSVDVPTDDELEIHGGNGGCTAVACVSIGVWPSFPEAVEALDAQIAPLHAKFEEERWACDESEAGICGEQWHEEAIKRALLDAGWHVRKMPIQSTRVGAVNLEAELADGSCYLAFGVTNNRWARRTRSGRPKMQPLKYPGFAPNAPGISSVGWHHTVAIIDGKLRDHHVVEPLSSLWLRPTNRPDRYLGYMRTIRKVWRVYKCEAVASFAPRCKGECCALGFNTA